MQDKEITGDALLANDADYVRGATATLYYAYPSATLPRFLVPESDARGLRFVLGLLTSEWGRVGRIARILLLVPGTSFLMRIFLFERTIVEP